ncbi:MAG: pseudouridine synthase [Patescibacteria group bacterium]
MVHQQKKGFKQPPPKPLGTVPTFPMRINKYLAFKSYSTRRGADEMIEKKQVFLNGRLAQLGDKVNEKDVVEVHFRGKRPTFVYYAYNKARGIVTHSAQRGEKDIQQVAPLRGVFPVGRLDKDSHGLIILTNDGRVTERLLGPRFEHEKEYLVTTKNPLRGNFKQKMEAGVQIEDEKTKPCKVQIINGNTFRVILTEGKKHQIRRMCVALFQEVDDLKRLRVMNVELGTLPEGVHRKIEGAELKEFLRSLDLV